MAGLNDGLIVHFPFNEDETGTIADQSGSANDGIAYGTTWAPGEGTGGARRFVHGDWIGVTNDVSAALLGDYTVTLWFRTGDPGVSVSGLVCKRGPPLYDYGSPCKLWAESRGGLSNAIAWVVGTGPSVVRLEVDAYYEDGEWTHLAAVMDGTNMTLYRDGESVAFKGYSGTRQANSAPLEIGRYHTSPSWFFDGLMDDVRIYNRALSPEQIQRLAGMRGSLTISPPSGRYVSTQGFDFTLVLDVPPQASVTGGSVLLDGRDVTRSIVDRMTTGTLLGGGTTFRVSDLSGSSFSPGSHTVEATLELAGGISLRDSAVWEIIENTEP
jgi:hypothetical protein